MQRSRLKNIVNKSKGFSKLIGEPFDNFKATLPNEVDENYRLEAAWKAYGSPKDFKEAVWNGMIQPIDENTYKFPSIGYNEETDEYEYLNKGKENETVAKDIRVWDNDVIPLVKELKQGGYIRVYNNEKDCWTYSKNREINSFKEGGKTKLITLLEANKSKAPFMVRLLTNDTKSIQLPNEKYPSTHLLSWGEIDGKTYIYPHIQPDENGNLKFYDKDALNRALETGDYLESDPENAKWFIENYKNYYPSFFNKFENGGELEVFKQGGKPEYKKVKSDKAYYDKDSDTVYYTNEEDLIHEGFHARPDSILLEQLKPYYENLNDEKIQNFGGNLQFVKRFEGDPGHFYSPEELGARILAAKYKTKGNNYTPEFFKYLRTNENQYGDNMRDLLYMYNDENLSKIFNLENTQQFKQGGQMNVIPSGSLHARKNNMELAKEGEITHKGIPVVDNNGVQQAEIERNEVIFNHSTTTKIEELYKKFNNTDSESEKDEIAIKAGKILTDELINNTQDNTGLIQEVAEKNNLDL